MKWSLINCLSLILVIGMALGCSKSDDEQLQIKGPDGEMSFKSSYYPDSESAPDCFSIISQTIGKSVYDALLLTLSVYNDTALGSELKLEHVGFGAMLSSNSTQFTNTYSGRMILKEKTDTRVTIKMENVHFNIGHGEYILNGDLVAKLKRKM